ncbi:hypothetical protein [Streptomyces sp. NPDC057694]|uniref:hypothetical protein n=1 Tax=Streptomyces sp. NPDC057694 TaxID=3346216 RepID=UPI0036AFF0F7
MPHIFITVTFGPALAGPGCILCPSPGSGLGFFGSGTKASQASTRRSLLVRVLLALASVLLLAWGSMSGHAIECVGAVIAAILVDAVAAIMRARTER